MNLAIMQPTFNPWIGYFELIDYVDTFVFLDTVQLNQQSWQTRNKIKVANQEYFVSLPIKKTKSKFDLIIKDSILDENIKNIKIKLLKTIMQEYKKANHFEEIYPFVEQLINYETPFLSKFNENIIKKISMKLNLNTTFINSSELATVDERKGLLVFDLCKRLEATTYYSPLNAKNYLEENRATFESNNIQIRYQNYKHPLYNQLGESFISYLGIFDLLLNTGFEDGLSIIRQGRHYEN